MANLRIIASNAARRATLSASSTAGALAVTNLQVDKKSDVWRAAGTTARITGALPVAELASGAALLGNFSPTTTMRLRLSNEDSATNLIKYSEQLNSSAWEFNATTISVDAAKAPDGTNTADKMVDTAAGGPHFRFQKVSGFAANQKITFSIFAKAAERSIVCLRFDESSTALAGQSNAYLNLVTGAVTGVTGNFTYQATQLADGWWRFSATSTTVAVGIICPLVMLATSGTDFSFTGNGSSGLYVWGAMLNVGALSSYYPATDSPGVRPAGFFDNWQSYDCDTGVALACPAPAIVLEGWSAVKSASAYAHGGGAFARAWFPLTAFKWFAIDLVDTNNLQGYIEAAQLVLGAYWSPTYNASSASATNVDATTHYRTDAGDLLSHASTIHKRIPIELEYMPAEDRAALARILRGSRAHPVFFSLYPGHPDLELERDNTMIGKRMSDSEIAVQAAIRYGTKLELESI